MFPAPSPGHSPAYLNGWNDAAAGDPRPDGCSPAYATGYDDYLESQDE